MYVDRIQNYYPEIHEEYLTLFSLVHRFIAMCSVQQLAKKDN